MEILNLTGQYTPKAMNNLEWKREVVDNGVNDLKTAVALSLAKWRYIVKNNGSNTGLTDKHPELIGMIGNCGLCELCKNEGLTIHECFYKSNDKTFPCPFIINNEICGAESSKHPWLIWHHNKTKVNAKVVLDAVKAIDIKAYQ